MPAFIVMHNTPKTIQLVPVDSFVSKRRVQKLERHHPLGVRVQRAMSTLFQPVQAAAGRRRFTLKELWDFASASPALENCSFLPENGQFPSRIIIKD